MIGMICERYIQPIIDKTVGLPELNKVLIIVMEQFPLVAFFPYMHKTIYYPPPICQIALGQPEGKPCNS